MVDAVAEKPVCGKCGFDVREGTTYCYNCGARVMAEADPSFDAQKTLVIESNGDGSAAGEPIIERTSDPKERVKNAAKERKKARVTARQPVEYRWEPAEDLGYTLTWTVIVTLVVALITGLMVFWK